MDNWTPENDEIKYGNQLIARTLGYEYFPFEEGKSVKIVGTIPVVQEHWGWHKPTVGHLKLNGWYLCRTHNELRYFNDWDWLYNIIDHIEKTYLLRITISTTFVRIHSGGHDMEYKCEVYGGKRQAAWNLIVDFLKLQAHN